MLLSYKAYRHPKWTRTRLGNLPAGFEGQEIKNIETNEVVYRISATIPDSDEPLYPGSSFGMSFGVSADATTLIEAVAEATKMLAEEAKRDAARKARRAR